MTAPYKTEWTLELPELTGSYKDRNLCVQVQRSSNGDYRAVLVDLAEFRGEGSTQGRAVDDLADELEHVAAEIRRASGTAAPDIGRARDVYAAVVAWRGLVHLVTRESATKTMLATIDAAISATINAKAKNTTGGPYR